MTKNGLLPAGCSRLKSQQQRKPWRRWWPDRLFQTEVAAAEKALAPMVAGLVREMTSAVDVEQRSADIRDPLQLSRQLL